MVPVRGSWGGWGLEKGQVSEFGIGTAEEASVHQAGFEEGLAQLGAQPRVPPVYLPFTVKKAHLHPTPCTPQIPNLVKLTFPLLQAAFLDV